MRLYDSLSKQLNDLVPRAGEPLGVYSCGPTVYDRIHVGNARPFVAAMTLKRHLERTGTAVRLVVNVTDVNDKIYVAAQAAGISSTELARRMTDAYVADTSALGLGRPDVEPLVTETLPEIVALIERLVARGLAYAADGDVYYRVAAFAGYGALSGQRPEELVDDARRIEPGAGKESPLDFALWKGRKADEDTWWDSPWGAGRPGWHVECSAMASKHLGEHVDVHGGGLDLIFPHHENERAQSEGACGCTFVGTWMHNGMLRFGGDKMSKSLGNVEKLADAIAGHGAATILMLFAQAHYRSNVEYSPATLAQASAACDRLRDGLRALAAAAGSGGEDDEVLAVAGRAGEAFDAALDDDLSSPEGVAALFGLVSAANRALAGSGLSPAAAAQVHDLLLSRLDVLGLAGLGVGDGAAPPELVALLATRQAAREARDWVAADAARDAIAAAGWTVRDTPRGPELVRS
jgi:cysteinyl-tRNA synthetase